VSAWRYAGYWRAAPGRASAIALGVAAMAAPFGAGHAGAAEPRSARSCSSCHVLIKKQWETSSMSRSWTNPVFQAFLSDARVALGDSVQARCIACHAPLASVTGDQGVTDPVNQEGVTCNFCHNVSAVDPTHAPASYTWDASDPNLMRGPFADADAGSAHKTVFSEIHTKSDFCASCHDYGSGPLMFENTFDEWNTSKAAAAGTRCQDCHMPPAPGKAAIIAKKTRDQIFAHLFLGAHTAGVLDSTAALDAAVENGKLKLTVRSTRGGHALPGGGASMRAITLEVAYLDAAGREISRSVVQTYDTEFADAQGNAPVPKWLAKSVARSNEIPADSARVEWAAIPAGANRAEAVLAYQFLLPAYRSALEARKVDLSGHDPVVMAKTTVSLP
jgi:hypothetical protein